ncbi:MAG TPA: AI-2E family transporter [Ktedonobacteraceae bacterium]
MEQKDQAGKNEDQDQLTSVHDADSDNPRQDENASAAGANNGRTRGNPGRFGDVRARLQAIRGLLIRTDRIIEDTARELPADAHGSAEETSRADDSVINLIKWSRRLVTPLAILAWAGIVILVLWLASYVSRTILLFIIAALLAYALAPLVKFLERRIPRVLAILIVYLIVFGAIVGLLYLVARTAIDQFNSLSGFVGGLLTPGNTSHPSPLENTLRSFGITTSQISSLRSQLLSRIDALAGNAVPVLSGVFSTGLDVIVVAVLSIYLLIDGRRTISWLQRNVPVRQRSRVRFLLDTLQRVVGGYIRGQLLLCTLVGVLVGVGMAFFRVPYALLLGVLAFFLEFIPIIGVFISGAICVLLALTQGWLTAVLVLAYFTIVHVIEGDVIGPRVVGRAVGVHPAVSLLALIAGGELFGITGALLASPVAGVIQAIVVSFWTEWRETHPEEFQGIKNQVADKVEKNVADRPTV